MKTSLSVHLLTAPGREAILAGTLASWDATDWGERPRVHGDAGTEENIAMRIPAAWHAMLRAALSGEGEYLLMLEDDLAFARHLRANLAAWPPWRAGRIATFASLYDPGVPDTGKGIPDTGKGSAADLFPVSGIPSPVSYFVPDLFYVQGAQALLLARPFAEHLAAHWEDWRGHTTSRRVALCAARDFPDAPAWYHRPSLVEHTATVSAWGCPLHRARDFRAEWRAE